jgi:PiT family inorganic phosphate transporter
MTSVLLVLIIAIALFFVFINGFHDTANVVATTISTRALSPYQAIIIAAIFNFIGAFFGTGVATTISKGLLDASLVTHTVLLSALIAAIIWNLLTWYFGIPSSSSHALIGALAGAGIATGGAHAVNYHTLVQKVIVPMVLSPLLAFFLALSIMIIGIIFLQKNNSKPRKTNNFIRELQVLSTSLLSFSHGSNDAQKNMSIIVMALFSFGLLPSVTIIPTWVTVVCGLALALGTVSGGMKIIKTLSTRVAKLRPVNGFSAELSSGLLIIGASHMGLPVSTTQAVSGSIMGAGYMGSSGVNWLVVRQMVIAWSLTLPSCILVGALVYKALHPILG